MDKLIITPLGTVSPYPKENKNCPGILIENKTQKLLLDCGSGVSRLLNFPTDLNNLMIIISHIHKDHYSDLSSFQYASYVYYKLGLLKERVKVYYPFFSFNSNNLEYNYAEKLLEITNKDSFLDMKVYFEKTELKYGEMNISFMKNPHDKDIETFSTKITLGNLSVVYTSDTAYNEKLIEFAKNSNLLICESTFLSNQKCTTGHMNALNAGLLAKKSNVETLMLTHFWPEIDKEEYVKEASQYFENTIAAEEGKKLILTH